MLEVAAQLTKPCGRKNQTAANAVAGMLLHALDRTRATTPNHAATRQLLDSYEPARSAHIARLLYECVHRKPPPNGANHWTVDYDALSAAGATASSFLGIGCTNTGNVCHVTS